MYLSRKVLVLSTALPAVEARPVYRKAPIVRHRGDFRWTEKPPREVQTRRAAGEGINPRAAMAPEPTGISRGQRAVAGLLVFVLVLPMLLSPSHPLAVYGFLASRYAGAFCSPPGLQDTPELSAFLTATPQLDRYRSEIRRDMADGGGGMLFAILRGPDGAYRHAPLRTWNSFLPTSLPESIRQYLDYKEVPYLGDEVALWLGGESIVAMGHYHPFGGAPSRGDTLARRLSTTSEIVVSNGLIPFVYLDGALLSYGETGPLREDVFRMIRMMEKNLTMALDEVPINVEEPTPALLTFLAFLKQVRQVDLDDRQAIGTEVMGLCNEFRSAFAGVFYAGFSPSNYTDDLDRGTMLRSLSATQMWAGSVGTYEITKAHYKMRVASGQDTLTNARAASKRSGT